MDNYDVIIIGGGSGGYAAARTAKESVDRVAIIDDAEELGGLCILRGCMPSKTLIYSAEILHSAQRGDLFGLDIPEAKADMPAIHQRKIRMIDDFKSYRQEQLTSDRFSLYRERATFAGPNTIRLEPSGRELTADAFIVATGSVASFPPVPGLDQEGIWTSDDVLELSQLPKSVIVLGGGVVACELAQFLNRVGSGVTQIQRSPSILKDNSEESAKVIMQAFRDEGISLYTGTSLQSVERAGDQFTVHFKAGDAMHSVSADHVVNAMGRRPAVDRMGLEKAGIEQLPGGQILVDDYQQTTNPKVYAVGDVCGAYEIVHIAIMQGETASRHATGRNAEPVNLATRTSVVFTDPQVAVAGIPLQEAKRRSLDVVSAEYPFNDHGKSILMEANYGYVKAWANRTSGRLIGAECVGKDAGELIHAMAVAVSLKAKVADLIKVHWYHPTLSEIWSYPLEDIVEELDG